MTLTAPDGSLVVFDSFTSVRAAQKGVHDPAAKSVVRSDGMDFAVRETLAEINVLRKADK